MFLMPFWFNAIKRKKKVLIVCNTVAEAQAKFSYVCDNYPNVKKLLYKSVKITIVRTSKKIHLFLVSILTFQIYSCLLTFSKPI